jgi:hypothetical protein
VFGLSKYTLYSRTRIWVYFPPDNAHFQACNEVTDTERPVIRDLTERKRKTVV